MYFISLTPTFAQVPPDMIDLGNGPPRTWTHQPLPALSALFPDMSPTTDPSSTPDTPYFQHLRIKARRKRACKEQVSVLNDAFRKDQFPTSAARLELATYLRMTPRAVQIWFQNKRQSLKSKSP
ncbi:hypothetical protein DSO57_1021796 [Entomophthora muscae]|uniref:Uncharacterized protein n=1 Tax=Entomophthora muscae TaxID=34485 RepID=A0ACC2T372_9FUNG|nr:hypothetical protein DSO57_1021796 [Entomophthora muscae]